MAAPTISDRVTSPSTPAREWASKTTSSLNRENIESITTSTELGNLDRNALESPIIDIPGAYPRGLDTPVDDVKDVAIGVYNTVKSYIPAQEDVQKVALNVSETAKQYLPQAVKAYFPPMQVVLRNDASGDEKEFSGSHEASWSPGGAIETGRNQGEIYPLPSQESSSKGFDTTNEVDSLSSSKYESGVVNIPEEPSIQTNSNTNAAENSDTVLRGNASAQSGRESDSLSNASNQAQYGSETSMSSHTPAFAPLHYPAGGEAGGTKDETTGTESTSKETLHPEGGIDSKKETHEVPLNGDTVNQFKPVQEPVLNLTPRTHPLGKDGAKWKGVPLSEGYQAKLDANPEHQLGLGAHDDHTLLQPQDTCKESQTEKAKDDMYGVKDKIVSTTIGKPSASTRPALLDRNPDSTMAHTGHSSTEQPKRVANGTKVDNTDPDSTESNKGIVPASGSLSRRSKFLDKIKGEVKVISGKLGHNDEKVEEGRRLMGKST